MANLIGQRLGNYEIVSLLGKGGMATVYRAQQLNIRRQVAVKVIKPDLAETEDFVRRFEREAETIASLRHPHILKLFDYGQQGDLVYLVMELLTGGGLSDLIRKGPLPLPTVIRIMEQVAAALDYAHRRGVIHRDLKPQNVLLDEDGNAFLTDFGIARLLDNTTILTQTGTVLGTPAYMAPEIWSGQAADARTDLYAIGIMLFEMLSGRLPFNADTPFHMMHLHVYEAPPSIRLFRAEIPSEVEGVITRALAKDREQRFMSGEELVSAVKTAFEARKSTMGNASTVVDQPTASAPLQDARTAEMPPPVVAPPQPTMPAAPEPSRPARQASLADLAQRMDMAEGVAPARSKSARSRPAGDIQLADLARRMDEHEGSASRAAPNSAPTKTYERALSRRRWIVIAVILIVGGFVFLRGGGLTAITSIFNPPRGKIIFVSEVAPGNEEIFVMNADGSASRQLTNNWARDKMPAWSPDGTRIAFASNRDGFFNIYVMDSNGNNQRRLTTNSDTEWWGLWPTWSPDGSTIALEFRNQFTAESEIWTIPAGGGASFQLTRRTAGGASRPRWSPDGRYVAYYAGTSTNRQIYVVNADGSNPEPLTDTSLPSWNPAWSPDSKTIIYNRMVGGLRYLYIMNSDGSNSRRMVSALAGEMPTWAPDGNYILMVRYAYSSYQTYLVDPGGTVERTLRTGYDPDWTK